MFMAKADTITTDALAELGQLFLGSRLKRLAERFQVDAAATLQAMDMPMQPAQQLLLATLHRRGPATVGALAGQRKGLSYDPELLYIGAMFHDMGLVPPYSSPDLRFEVDGANAARDFLRAYGIGDADVEQVWDAIALHTTPGIPEHKKPVVALVTAGVEMDVLGLAYDQFTEAQRRLVVAAHPRGEDFKEGIIDAFTQGTIKKPLTTFGNVKADVLALKDPTYQRQNFCSIILGSAWPS